MITRCFEDNKVFYITINFRKCYEQQSNSYTLEKRKTQVTKSVLHINDKYI
jgi:hypothetical protein